MHPAAIAYFIGVVFAASVAQTVAGFGFALIAMPFLITVLDVRDAIVAVSICAQLNSTLVAVSTWQHVPRGTVGRLLFASFAGMPLGLAVLLLAPEPALRIVVAACSIVMAGALMAGMRFGGGDRAGEIVAGGTSGVLATSTGMNGPPIVLFLQDRGYPRDEFRGALSSFFFVSGIVSFILLALSGVVQRDAVLIGLGGLPAVWLGNNAGARLVGRLEPEIFRRFVLMLLIATSIAALALTVARMA